MMVSKQQDGAGYVEIVRMLLGHRQMDVNARDKLGRTAFLWASYKGHWEIVREFLKHDEVDVNVEGPQGNTALFWATLRGQLDVVRDMLKHDKINVHHKNKAGSTVLDIARKCDLHDIASLLEKRAQQSSRSLERHASAVVRRFSQFE